MGHEFEDILAVRKEVGKVDALRPPTSLFKIPAFGALPCATEKQGWSISVEVGWFMYGHTLCEDPALRQNGI